VLEAVPGHFREFSPPEMGDFSSRDRGAYEEWVRSFSQVSDLHVIGEQLLVETRNYDAEELTFRRPDYTLDIYRASDLDARAVGIATPGKLVTIDGSAAFLSADSITGAVRLITTSFVLETSAS